MLLMIDNYDSFTYNIAQYFGELNQEVKVVRNDAVTLEDIERWQPKYLVIGPGPCSPSEAGISIPVLAQNKKPAKCRLYYQILACIFRLLSSLATHAKKHLFHLVLLALEVRHVSAFYRT